MSKKEFLNWFLLIFLGVVSYWAINNLDAIKGFLITLITIFKPFLIGGALAFILNIPMVKIENFLKKKAKKESKFPFRFVSIVLSLLILILVVILVAFLLIPELIKNIELLIANLPILFSKAETFVLDLVDRYPELQVEIAKLFNTSASISTLIGNVLNYILNGAISIVTGLVSGVITVFTALIFAVYTLSQKEYLINGSKKMIKAYLKPRAAQKTVEVARLINITFSKFISGQCLESVILGSIFFVTMSILGFPYALLISVLTAITSLIPIVGAWIAIIVGAILIAITNPFQALLFVIIFLAIQQIEGNLIYPKVVGASVGLPAIWTLLAISVAGSIMGFIGMFIGLPVASVAYSLIKKDANNRINRKSDIDAK